VTPSRRRFFWGRSLAQALARAARHFGAPPDALDYRVREKRHGFVKHPRAVLLEIDPEHPTRLRTEPVVSEPPPARTKAAMPARARPRGGDEGAAEPGAAEPRRRRATSDSSWEAPDADSELAAIEAAQKLIGWSGLDLEPSVRRSEDRLELELSGGDVERLRGLGVAILDAFEVLLPRAIFTLSGRHVRCRVDGGGLRSAAEAALRRRARELAEQVAQSGHEELLEPLGPAERRIVHLELEAYPGVSTESVGGGFEKRVRIFALPTAER